VRSSSASACNAFTLNRKRSVCSSRTKRQISWSDFLAILLAPPCTKVRPLDDDPFRGGYASFEGSRTTGRVRCLVADEGGSWALRRIGPGFIARTQSPGEMHHGRFVVCFSSLAGGRGVTDRCRNPMKNLLVAGKLLLLDLASTFLIAKNLFQEPKRDFCAPDGEGETLFSFPAPGCGKNRIYTGPTAA
jgi:hypothetical protein